MANENIYFPQLQEIWQLLEQVTDGVCSAGRVHLVDFHSAT
jgi:hypothetical protein